MRNPFAKVSDPHEFATCPGEDIAVVYSPVVGSDGTIELVESGKYSVQDKIESFRDTTDIAYLVSRLMAGDTSVTRDKFFGDFSKMPESYQEILQLRIDAEKHFMELPLDVRSKFDFDVNKYIATAGQESWFRNMGFEKIDEKDEVKEEVKENEP